MVALTSGRSVSGMSGSKIVLGFDGTPEARDALALAGGLARAQGAELLAVVAYDFPTLPVTVIDPDPDLAERAEGTLRELEQKLPGVEARALVVCSSSPARALHDVAEREHAELIVVGSSSRGRIGRVMPGSVGERLLHGAPCAVAAAPRGYARHQHFGLGLVGIAFDGGDEARAALATARRIAIAVGARLRVIGVIAEGPAHRLGGGDMSSVRTELGKRLQEAAEFARCEDADGHRVEVAASLREGRPAEVLADEGIELDLLVLGSRGYGPLRHAIVGGVSDRVIRIAPCPVLVVPRGGHPPPSSPRKLRRLFSPGTTLTIGGSEPGQ
jgi:nucleotide-binding universal stress UspA family protein